MIKALVIHLYTPYAHRQTVSWHRWLVGRWLVG